MNDNTHKPKEQKNYNDLTDLQQSVLDLYSRGADDRTFIANEVGCSHSYPRYIIRNYGHLVSRTPEGTGDQKLMTDGGQDMSSGGNASTTVQIQCNCGEVHEVTID